MPLSKLVALASVVALTALGSLTGCTAGSGGEGASASADTERPAATAQFIDGNWDPSWQGDLKGGGSLTVNYDMNRLTQCRNTSSLDSWVIDVSWRFDGGRIQTETLLGPGSSSENNTISIPEGAHQIELWFENHAVGGYDHCSAFDSKFGANYTHAID